MRILATCFQGLGNNVLFTPAVRMMSAMFPYVTIDVVSKFPEIWYGLPDVNPLNGPSKFQSYYDIGFTAIFGTDVIYPNVNIGDRLRAPIVRIDKHEIALNAEPVYEYGYVGDVLSQHVPRVPDLPKFAKTDRAIIGIADCSKPRSYCRTEQEYLIWAKKRWPHYQELIRILLEMGFAVAIFGTHEDGPHFNMEPFKHGGELYDLRGNYSVSELASAIKQTDVFVTNDSGPMHVADAAGANTVAIFGPTSIEKNAPIGPNSLIIDAQEITGIEEPQQGSKEFAQVTKSPSLEALSVDVILGAIDSFKPEGEVNWL